MTDLNVVASVVGETGYAVHSSNLCTALIKEGINLSIEHAPFQSQDLEAELIEAIKKTPKKGTPNLVINLPYFWSLKSAQDNTIGYLVFEGSKIAVSWKHCIEREHVKQVWVPSQHVKQACLNAGVSKPVHVIPHGVDVELFNPNASPLPALKSEVFTFLYSGGWSQGDRDRRAVDVLIKAVTEEFKKGEARLVLKINTAYQSGFDVLKAIEALNKPGNADVLLLNKNLPYKELPGIYKAANVFVLPTKAEGFGLTALESMACGVPVIATGYGGQTDFINNENGWLIDYDLQPATDGQVFYEEALWGMPRLEHLKALMRQAFNDKEEVKRKGLLARKKAEEFTWQASALKAKALLEN